MFIQREAGEITTWFVCFTDRVPSRIWKFFIPGRWKHCYAFGHCAEAATWCFYDPEYKRVKVYLVPDHLSAPFIQLALEDGVVLKINSRELTRANIRVPHCCTMTIRQLIGLPGWGPLAAIPDRLFVDCIHAGATVVGSGMCFEKNAT